MKHEKDYKYFIYSEEQFKEKNEILNKSGKEFIAGVVVVNGKREKFTQLSTKPELPRFIDTKIITKGYIDQFVYSMPKIIKKRGI